MSTTTPELPKGFRLQVTHLHDGNSKRKDRHGHKYMTVARIYDTTRNVEVACAYAACSKADAPRRSVGRQVAIGRVMKKFEKREEILMNLHAAD